MGPHYAKGFFAAAFLLASLAVPFVPANAAPQEKTSNSSASIAGVKTDTASASKTPNNSGEEQPPSSSLRLGPGDLIEVSVYNVSEFTTKARIGANGDVYLPLIDYVHVADLTADEAQELIEKRLSDGGFFNNPHVTVLADEYASESVKVLGAVAKPGSYSIIGQEHLLDLISAAGGLNDRAGSNAVITHRGHPDQPETVTLNGDLTANSKTNIEIFPGDTIIVRKADVVYVVGDVQRPAGLMMNSGDITVLQAIAMAGGATRTSKLNGAKILRKGPNGIVETPVKLQQILEEKAADIPMQADDILFVPSSSKKVAFNRSMDAVMQTASSLSVIAVHP